MKIKKAFGETDFESIKSEGCDFALIKDSDDIEKASENAQAFGVGLWIKIEHGEEIHQKMIEDLGGRVSEFTDVADIVTPDFLEELLNRAGKYKSAVSGVIVNFPDFHGNYIWNDDLETWADENFLSDDWELFDLFDSDKEISFLRMQYFKKAEEFVYERYIKPLLDYCKKNKILVCFDLEDAEIEYDLALRFIDIFRIKRENVPVLLHSEREGTKFFAGILKGNTNFVMYKNGICDVTFKEDKKDKKSVLLVIPTRGTRCRMYKMKKGKIHMEIPGVLASVEANYNYDLLSEQGCFISVVSDRDFEKEVTVNENRMVYKDESFENLLVSESSMLCEKACEIIENARKIGVKINE